MESKASKTSIRKEGNAFVVCREGRDVRTPSGAPLAVFQKALVEALAAEIDRQGEKPDVRKMPFVQMAQTAIDIVGPRKKETVESLIRYGETELLCQRAESPADLAAAQDKAWKPYLDWCEKRFGAALKTGSGIVPPKQDEKALASLRRFLEAQDAFVLEGLSAASGATGSLVLALALMEGRATVGEAFEAAEFDSLWQSKTWGEDPLVQARHAEIRRDIEMCAAWFSLLKS